MSPSRQTPWTQRMREILADGQWHTRESIIAACGPLIPPGRAIRRREQSAARLRMRAREQGKPAGRALNRSVDFNIAVGRRDIIVQALRGPVERRVDEHGVVWVRTAPDRAYPQGQRNRQGREGT